PLSVQQWTQIQALLRIQLPNDALTIRKLRLTDFPVPLLPRPQLQRRETSRQRWQAKENREAGVPDTQGVADSSTSPPVSNTVSSALDRLLASRSKKA
ncbi:hypothetical protein NLO85_28345, partial [Pseudomonas savastanoi]|nr:hypothetical protein [Pseudomonas savastanoi]